MSNPLFPTVFMTHLQPINCFVPASQANSKCVSRSAAILLSNFIKNLASRKIIKKYTSIRLILHYFSLKSDFKTVKYLHRNLTLKIDISVYKCIGGLTNSPTEKKMIEILISDWLTSLGREESIAWSEQDNGDEVKLT